MTREVFNQIQAWLEANQPKKGRLGMKRDIEGKGICHCIYGVFTEAYMQAHPEEFVWEKNGNMYGIFSPPYTRFCYPPEEIHNWLEISQSDFDFLIKLNDDEDVSFETIMEFLDKFVVKD